MKKLNKTNAKKWMNEQKQLFIQLIVDIVIRKGKQSPALFTEEWKDMCRKLYQRTRKKYDPKQLRN